MNEKPIEVTGRILPISPATKRRNPHIYGEAPVAEERTRITHGTSYRQSEPFELQGSIAKYFNEVEQSTLICRGTLLGEPCPKQRPRLGRNGNIYTPGTTKDYQVALASAVVSQLTLPPPSDITVGLRAAFYCRTHQRKDVDNMLKSLLDGMNKLAFSDDSQVKELMGWSFYDFENPRTEWIIYKIGTKDKDSGLCLVCGQPFQQTSTWKLRLFCSEKCWRNNHPESISVKCDNCGKLIAKRPPLHKRNYCNPECKYACERIGRVKVECVGCGKTFKVPKSAISRGAKFCSKECYWKAKVGKARTHIFIPLP